MSLVILFEAHETRIKVVRIFLPLSMIGAVTLLIAMTLGLMIDDPKVRSESVQTGVQYHFLMALFAVMFAAFVHAIVLTYFMGTGRWIEETSNAYRLGGKWHEQTKTIKYRTIPLMVVCFLMLLLTVGFGAAADPASPMQSKGIGGIPANTVHLAVALATVAMNLVVNWLEFRALERNGEIIDQVLAEVRRIRLEKGLAVDA